MQEPCLQSRIWKEWFVIFFSIGIVVLSTILLLFVFPQTDRFDFENKKEDIYQISDLVNFVSQKQLFWGVVALTSFIGFFQFLDVINNRRLIWLYRVLFLGFISMLVLSVTRIANQYIWVATLEKVKEIPIEGKLLHDTVLPFVPWLAFIFCLVLWIIFLCLFLNRVTSISCGENTPKSAHW